VADLFSSTQPSPVATAGAAPYVLLLFPPSDAPGIARSCSPVCLTQLASACAGRSCGTGLTQLASV